MKISQCMRARTLLGLPLLVSMAALGATPAAGPLRVGTVNPRYFVDPDGRPVYLTGSHTWQSLQDGILSGYTVVTQPFDYAGYLDLLQANHHNVIRLWRWELTTHEPQPWQRTGPGQALDGKPKFDLGQFNQDYIDRLRSRVAAAQKRGIYVSIMLFQGWSVEKKGQAGNPWQGHPFNRASNINGIDGDLNGDGQGPEIHTVNAPAEVLWLQQAYVRRVIDTVNDLDNVLYEIGNEMHTGSVQWQYRMIEFIHEYEKTKPKQYPVGMTGAPIENAALFDSPADWIASTGSDGYSTDPPAADGRKVIISDVDHVWPKRYRQWVWKSFTRGLNTAFMDLYGATRIGDKDVASFGLVGDWCAPHDTVRKNLGYTRIPASRVNLARMMPHPELASTRYCLAGLGREYVVYAPSGGTVVLDLANVESVAALNAEWLDPRTGAKRTAGIVTGGKQRSFTCPDSQDWVLCLQGGPASASADEGIVQTPDRRPDRDESGQVGLGRLGDGHRLSEHRRRMDRR